jgi:6-pyruvoyltetrahydropterin/6-carboxytetrahydropterin synthase
MSFSIRRSIEIDMGHRVPTHGSKCWNLHGHRYVIECEAYSETLQAAGVQTDMVLDFSFLKHAMMTKIHDLSDHGFCLWVDDPWLDRFIDKQDEARAAVKAEGYHFVPEDRRLGHSKLMIVPFIPTAERLAEFWFKLLRTPVMQLANGKAELSKIHVWETPNCVAIYPTSVNGARLTNA